MNPKQQFCHEKSCHASGQIGQGNIVIHSRADKRYKCKCCGKTFTESKGTAVYGLKKAPELYVPAQQQLGNVAWVVPLPRRQPIDAVATGATA